MIYLDNAATTKIRHEVLDAMMPYLTDLYGNPGGIYRFGRDAKHAVENAREQVAEFMHTTPEHIIFTSGGSEGNNLVLKSFQGKKIFSSSIEHDSIYCNLIRYGCTGIVNPNKLGEIETKSVIGNISDIKTTPDLISIMYVNNETGVKNNIRDISNCIKEKYPSCLFHSDCVQAAGNYEIDVDYLGIDFATVSSHKIYGPKGVGAIYARYPNNLTSLICGGASQEFGIRGGTENVAGIVGFGKACELTGKELRESRKHFCELKRAFVDTMHKNIGNSFHINGNSGIYSKAINIRIDGIDTQTLILMLDNEVCISAGSACNSYETTPSRVLKSMGISDEECRESFRVSFSIYNTLDEIRLASSIICDKVKSLKNYN